MIMAHDRPDHLATLVSRLDCDWIRVFIHVDAKVAIDPFRDLISKDDRVRFLLGRERVAVNWGGYSTVEATLSLLQAALNSPERFDRFCLLSGADFPIKSLNDLHRGLDSQVEFIRVDRRLDDTEDSKHSRYVRYAHSRDGPTKDGSHKGPRKVYDKICLYHGSTWWALTEDASATSRITFSETRIILNFTALHCCLMRSSSTR